MDDRELEIGRLERFKIGRYDLVRLGEVREDLVRKGRTR